MKRIFAALALFAATASFARAAEMPDTPAGHAAAAWVNAMNSGDKATLQAFIDKYHRKSKADDLVEVHKVFGEITVLEIQKNEPNHVIAILGMATADEVLRIDYQTDPKDSTNLVFAQIGGVERPDDLAIPRLTQSEAMRVFQAKIDELVAKDQFMGVVLIESHGKILMDKAWGYGDRDAKIPLQVTDKFRLGSMNKMFTAASIMQLVGQRKVSLDGTVG